MERWPRCERWPVPSAGVTKWEAGRWRQVSEARNREKSAVPPVFSEPHFGHLVGGHAVIGAASRASDSMDIQPASLETLSVGCRELRRQMVELLRLRAKIASLEKVGNKNSQRAEKTRDLRPERRA